MIITDREVSEDIRGKLTERLLDISGRGRGSGKRPLEVTIFNQKDLNPWRFPPRYEYMYGEWLRRNIEAGEIPQACSDPDAAILLWQARKYGRTLKGAEAEKLIPYIPFGEIQKAVQDSLPGLMANLKGDERNVLLTLSRMWFTLENREICSKDIAAEWVCPRLPKDMWPLLEIAKEAYLGYVKEDWEHSENQAIVLAGYMGQKIEEMVNGAGD